jgi:hypothetical protein
MDGRNTPWEAQVAGPKYWVDGHSLLVVHRCGERFWGTNYVHGYLLQYDGDVFCAVRVSENGSNKAPCSTLAR